MKTLNLRYFSILATLVFSFIICSNDAAYADHSLANPCYTCHNLKSSGIIVGSRSISSSRTYLTSAPNNYVAGGPFDCSFCHVSLSDIPELFNYPGTLPTDESSHPVDVINDEDDNVNELVCADCHLLETSGTGAGHDVAPLGLQSKDGSDGYPNHKWIDVGFTLYSGVDYPNDASNRTHLVAPYGKKVYTGSDLNRSVNWGGTLDNTTLLCFVCHSATNLATGVTLTGNWAAASYSIEAEYNKVDDQGVTAGHVIRTAGGTLAVGDKMPCYNCHDSHAATGAGSNKKLIRNTTNPYSSSSFSVTGYDYTNTQIICAGCHDTGVSATTTGTTVEGLTPVDPYDFDVANSKTIHINNGVLATLANSTVGCLNVVGSKCHSNAHNPKAIADSDDQPCFPCHGGVVNDSAMDPWGRGGDFGANNTKTTTVDATITSAHNIDFDATNHGADNPLGTRGSCTVCHTVEKRLMADGTTLKLWHGDGDPRNDFRDVSPTTVDELDAAPVLINDTEGYRYDPPWLLCIDCHDNETDTTEDYYGLIGNNVSAPLNLDQFIDITTPTPLEYVYGAGDFDNSAYHDALVADAMAPPSVGTDNNATPVKRYNLQPYKAHYKQTDSSGVLHVLEPSSTTTDPLNAAYPSYDATAASEDSTSAAWRVVACLDCHNSHGGENASLYRSPRQTPTTGLTNANGRDICLDCHNDTVVPQIDFPPQMQVTQGGAMTPPNTRGPMMVPPATDRYLNDIPEHSDGVTSCSKSSGAVYACHNPHSPSCETCHGYPAVIGGGVDIP